MKTSLTRTSMERAFTKKHYSLRVKQLYYFQYCNVHTWTRCSSTCSWLLIVANTSNTIASSTSLFCSFVTSKRTASPFTPVSPLWKIWNIMRMNLHTSVNKFVPKICEATYRVVKKTRTIHALSLFSQNW